MRRPFPARYSGTRRAFSWIVALGVVSIAGMGCGSDTKQKMPPGGASTGGMDAAVGGASTVAGAESGGQTQNGGGSGNREQTGGSSPSGSGGGSAIAPDGGQATGPNLFDDSRIYQFELQMAAADWQKIVADALADAPDAEYYHASFSCEGVTIADVAVRAKGSIPEDATAKTKASLKLDFDRFVVDQEFGGQVKINLQNNLADATQLREYLSYGAWRDFKVAAPRTGWAEVKVNGEALGLYTIVEQVSGRFLEANFPEARRSGDMYQPEAPAGSLEYRGATIADYPGVGHERMPDTDHSAFLHFVDVLNRGTSAELSSVLDINGALTYLAGNVALGNRANYLDKATNYFLYESTPGVFTLLPWDMNKSQKSAKNVCGPGSNPRTDGLNFVLGEKLLGDATHVKEYFKVMRTFLKGPGSAEALNARIDSAQKLLTTRLDETAIAELRARIGTRVTDLLAQLDSTSSCPLVVPES